MPRQFLMLIVLAIASAAARAEVVVHEWGTFTSLQNEQGKELGSINTDVEPLPSFVSDAMPGNSGGKGVPIHDSVTMRLETPVVYFHLPQGSEPMHIGFKASFIGGYLTQYYPIANATKPTLPIKPETVGTLEWKDVLVGKPMPGPQTKSNVWLAPRNVNAADVSVGSQAERYLFYRGVGHVASPISVVRKGDQLEITNVAQNLGIASSESMRITKAWYLDIATDGKSVFRPLAIDSDSTTASQATITAADFKASDYSTDSIAGLRAQMKESLMAAGLFDDEAAAMLNTWDESYFKSVGSRVLFIVPRAWTNHYLPIELSVPAKIERVMVGRVDLITPKQRDAVRAIQQRQGDVDTSAKLLGRFFEVIRQDTQMQDAPNGRRP